MAGWTVHMCVYEHLPWLINIHTAKEEFVIELSRFLKGNQLVFIKCLLRVKSCIMGCEEKFQSSLLLLNNF